MLVVLSDQRDDVYLSWLLRVGGWHHGDASGLPTLTITNAGSTAPEVFNGGPTAVTGSYLPTETMALATVKSSGTILSTAAGNCSGAGGLKNAVFGVAPTTGTF
jgi:hypothetical protein